MLNPAGGMELAVQLLMGVSLAACCGLRAFLPVLVVGLLHRSHYLTLNPQVAFLGRDDVLVIFGCATVLEILADKVIALDHLLDFLGTALRPAAGAILAAGVISELDPTAALVLGQVLGGGTALTVHAGKAIARFKSTSLALFHHGGGNAGLSFVEDVGVGMGLWTAATAPLVAFLVALALLTLAVCLIRGGFKLYRQGRSLLRNPETAPRNGTTAHPD